MVISQEGSSMKKLAILSIVLLLAALILLPRSRNGKYDLSKPVVADGWPLPPPIPPGSGATLIADGWPLPPPIPPGSGATLIADGWPLPPPIPPGSGATLIADGWPLPPPIPPSANTGTIPFSV